MLNAGVLTFQEYAMREPLPLATIHEELLDFLNGRTDIVLFGAQAVNAYVSEPRMTQDIDLLSTDAKNLAEELRLFLGIHFLLSEQLIVSVEVREVADGKRFRVYQVRKEGNRHLVDVRQIEKFPDTEVIENIQILSPLELIISKVISFHSRYGKPKSWTDRRDLAVLLLRFPELKEKVVANLQSKNVSEAILETWAEIESQGFEFEGEDEDLIF